MDVEKMLPDYFRRRFTVREETVYPNKKTGLMSKLLTDQTTLRRIALAVIEHGSEVRIFSPSVAVMRDVAVVVGDVTVVVSDLVT